MDSQKARKKEHPGSSVVIVVSICLSLFLVLHFSAQYTIKEKYVQKIICLNKKRGPKRQDNGKMKHECNMDVDEGKGSKAKRG